MVLSASVAALSADHSNPPCAAASAESLSALRPTRTGSGISRSPFLSGNPPSLRIAMTERIRCWLVPSRPVAPSIAMRSVLVAMVDRSLLLGGPMQFGGMPRDGSLAALEHSDGFAQFGNRLSRARRLDNGHIGGIPDLHPVVLQIHQLRRTRRNHLEAFGN